MFRKWLLLPILLSAATLFAADKKTAGFDASAIDRDADPCRDFYQYACGVWMANNPIPADESSYGRFRELEERNRLVLKGVLEKAAAGGASRTPDQQKIGDYYATCMDETAIEKLGAAPMKKNLDRIAGLKNRKQVFEETARLHREGYGAFFLFDSQPDFKDSKVMIADVDQGGLGLPDRDYYLKKDARSEEIRKQYVAHMEKMFVLLGESKQQAAKSAAAVMAMETKLAEHSLPLVERRDPDRVYHFIPLSKFAADTPHLDWKDYLAITGAPSFDNLNVSHPEFFRSVNDVIGASSLEDLKTYLRWHVLSENAPLLSSDFVNENFVFFGTTLTGAQQLRPRWKRCVDRADGLLGFALGKGFVEATFGAEGKARTLDMVNRIEKALGSEIQTLDWMSPATKQQAMVKLNAVRNKIGYPDKWRDYSSVEIIRGDAVGNDMRAGGFEFRRVIDRIGKPTDPNEWGMSPPTVNAYYDPTVNNINFPAGILQPPFYDNKMDDAVNFGAIGAVVGHELTHGFDDTGRQFDAVGNLHDWWTPEDAKEFERRAQCFVEEYEKFSPVDGVHLNGKLTLGENAADNGGVRIAFKALMDSMGDRKVPKIDGFTPEQRFFLAWGQVWCQNIRDEAARLRAQTDPHSPGRFRINGVVQNMPEFQKAFGCPVGAPMVRQPACRIW
jgi:putative endopeptidase